MYVNLQANGLDERFNQTLQNMLVKFVHSKKETWSSFLDTCVFAYNTSRHESTRFTPFELMFGRRATLPIDLELQKASPKEVGQKYLQLDDAEAPATVKEHAERLEAAKENILLAQQKQKAHYDKKHANPARFQLERLVLKKDFTRKKTKGGKLKERYLGPYIITKILPHGVYEIAVPTDTSKTFRATGAHLKPYNEPSNDPPSSSEQNSFTTNDQPIESQQNSFTTHDQPIESQQYSFTTNDQPIESQQYSFTTNDQPIESQQNSFTTNDQPQYELSCLDKSFRISPDSQIDIHEQPDHEESCLNLSVSLLPPPLPSYKVCQDINPQIDLSAPVACSTLRTSTYESDCVAEKVVPSAPMTKVQKRNQWRKHEGNKRKRPRKELQHILLTPAESVVVAKGDMLTDVHISNASQLLRQQFPQIQGLQSPVYGQALTFQKAEAPFVQIVHTGGSHWSTIAGAPDSTVKVYDSLFPGISLSVKMQAAAIIRPERSHLLFEMERTQFQQGGADCGLFAIAYAVDYCYGNNPATKRYAYTNYYWMKHYNIYVYIHADTTRER